MQEGQEESPDAHSLDPAEQEKEKERAQALRERHSALTDELRRLVAEEGDLIAKSNSAEADDIRIDEINKREIEIINMQKQMIDEIARFRGYGSDRGEGKR